MFFSSDLSSFFYLSFRGATFFFNYDISNFFNYHINNLFSWLLNNCLSLIFVPLFKTSGQYYDLFVSILVATDVLEFFDTLFEFLISHLLCRYSRYCLIINCILTSKFFSLSLIFVPLFKTSGQYYDLFVSILVATDVLEFFDTLFEFLISHLLCRYSRYCLIINCILTSKFFSLSLIFVPLFKASVQCYDLVVNILVTTDRLKFLDTLLEFLVCYLVCRHPLESASINCIFTCNFFCLNSCSFFSLSLIFVPLFETSIQYYDLVINILVSTDRLKFLDTLLEFLISYLVCGYPLESASINCIFACKFFSLLFSSFCICCLGLLKPGFDF